MKKCLMVLVIMVFWNMAIPSWVNGHDVVNGGGILYTEPIHSVLFTHQSHLEKKLTCDQCHSGLFEMEALKAQEKKDFTMASLYKGKYCGACHNGKAAFAADTQCARCHIRVKGMGPQKDMPVYKTSESFGQGKRIVRYNHEIHTRNIKCSACHPGLFKVKKGADKVTMADHGTSKYCFSCHDGSKAFSWNDCSRCHAQMPAPKTVVAFGKKEKAVLFQHSTHLSHTKCGSCHIRLFPFKKGATRIAFADHSASKVCFSCHREKGTAFYSDCNRCHTDRGNSGAQQGPAPLTYTVQGAEPVKFVHKSHGSVSCDVCHPKLFTMKKGATKMVMNDMYQGKGCGTCHDGNKAFRAMECAKCHKGN